MAGDSIALKRHNTAESAPSSDKRRLSPDFRSPTVARRPCFTVYGDAGREIPASSGSRLGPADLGFPSAAARQILQFHDDAA